jgi:hypothetical protein
MSFSCLCGWLVGRLVGDRCPEQIDSGSSFMIDMAGYVWVERESAGLLEVYMRQLSWEPGWWIEEWWVRIMIGEGVR